MPRGWAPARSRGGSEQELLSINAEDFADFAKQLRKFQPELRKQMRKDISAAAKPVVAEMRAEVKGMPVYGGRHTGLRARVARTVRFVNRDTGKAVSIRITSDAGRMPGDQRALPAHMNKGSWRHPVYGNREKWETQIVTPGWFTRPANKSRPQFVKAVQKALDDAVKQISH